MEPRTVEQVESWSTRSVADGYAGLRELSDGEFSGAVRAGGAWLFMLNGRIVGVFEGSLDDFEDADATAYAAPHPSLPLLFSMQEQGGDTRAKYYTNDTPLTEVDETLSEGKFTGFVELSENVLSGDYYVAYYGGRSMSVAFVGASEQVVTGDDAFERAADEVGIYEVTDVDVEVTDVPEPEGDDDPSDVASGAATGSGATSGRASGGKTAGGGAADDRTTGGGGSSDADPAAGSATGSNVDATTESNTSATTGSDLETTDGSNADPASGGSSTASADATETDASQQPPSPAEEGTSGTTANDPSGGQPAASRPPADERSATDERSTTDQRPDRKSAGGSSAGSSDASSAQSSSTSSTQSSSTSSTGSSGASSTGPAANDPVEGSADMDAGPESPSPGRAVDSERTADAAGEAAVEPESTTRAESTSDSADPDRDATGSGASADAAANRPASGEAAKENDPTRDAGATERGSSATSGEAEWRETTTIPSLDPDLSDDPDETASESRTGATAAAESDRRGASESGSRGRSRPGEGTGRSRRSDTQSGSPTEAATAGGSSTSAGGSDTPTGRSGTSAGGSSASEGGADDGSGSSSDARTRIRKLRKQLEQRKQQVEQLKERLSTLESERDEYRRERDALSQEVERLEAKLEGAESAGGAGGGRRLTETEAFDGTNLFVRYESKGEATLDEAADGQAERGDVNANLRLEHHTQFEADEASVDGDPFESFLAGSFEYEFASWIVEDLLYEVRDTGHRNALKDLYEAIPKIDRVDLHGSVSAGGDDDTRQESFDVIMRDRMGDPLVVADLNGSREPTTGEMMGSLVDAASGVADAHDELAGAFQVTESFFEPEALETAETATSGGLLSREKRASFVKRSRKRGYHLCLVESRSGDFHLNVPEL